MRLEDLARTLNAEFRGDPELDIKSAAGLENAAGGDVAFLSGRKHLKAALGSAASCILVAEFQDDLAQAQIKVPDPHRAFGELLGRMHPRTRPGPGVSPEAHIDKGASIGEAASVGAGAVISPGASVGARTIIYPGAYVGFNVSIGEDTVIYPNVSIMDGVSIGNRVVVHAGSVIGSDGFGYLQRDGAHVKIPQVGSVRIEDDVELGACVCIDRATTSETVIGAGTKLDNLVHVAHNVTLGRHVVFAAQAGIAGSTTIGDHLMSGGQVAISDHVDIEAGTMLAARTGVHTNLKKGIYAGAPALPHREFLKATPLIGKLPDLFRRLKELEKKINAEDKGESV